ncbi:MAG: amino acid transporter [Rhodobacteraceae bacterium]|nr:amino acid transporter [Paracoccaceae bacterium]
MFTTALSGFGLGLSLITAIGSQNAFVLRQGLRGEYVFWICLVCAVSDAALILIGVTSLSTVTRIFPAVESALRYAGAAFLTLYGARSALSAWRGGNSLEGANTPGTGSSLKSALIVVFLLTFLNPHVYLDTVLLLGSIASQYPGEELIFGAGATTASFLFFFSLGYGAQLLRPVFQTPLAWRILDALIALVMWSIASSLVFTH